MTDAELLQAIYHDVREVKEDIKVLKEDVKILKEDVKILKEDVRVLKIEVANLDKRTTNLEKRMKSMELTIENVTNKGIMFVAEGHLDLSRKLDDALKIENEREMNAIRLRILEDDMRKIKDHLGVA